MSRLRKGFSRRAFPSTSATGLASLSSVLSIRANAQAVAGALLMVPETPDPNGTVKRLFLLQGDPLAGPIRRIVTEESNPVPAPVLEPAARRMVRLMHFNDMHGQRGDTHRMSQI